MENIIGIRGNKILTAEYPTEDQREQDYRRGYADGWIVAAETMLFLMLEKSFSRSNAYKLCWNHWNIQLLNWVLSNCSALILPPALDIPKETRWSKIRKRVLMRDRHVCQYCGERAEHVDHIMPRSRGGSNALNNLVAACAMCNWKKRDKTPEEAGMSFLKRKGGVKERGSPREH